MSPRFAQPPDAPPRTLGVRTRCVIGRNGVRSLALLTYCPRRDATISVDVCQRCPHLAQIDLQGDRPSVACACHPGTPASPLDTRVGALARPVALCVRAEARLAAFDEEDALGMVPVVDDADRYVGAVVTRRSSAPPSADADVLARLGVERTAEDALGHMPAVHERDGLVKAASAMTSSRARCLAVVNDERVVVGVVDDLALLGAAACAARTRRGPRGSGT